MDYQQTLEKAILEHAAKQKASSYRQTDAITKIPGFMDDHVWGMAMQLSEQDFLEMESTNGSPGVRIGIIRDDGTRRLEELVTMQQAERDDERQRSSTAAAMHKKKWWQRRAPVSRDRGSSGI